MQDGNRSMHIKKCSQRTKHLERRLRRMNDPSAVHRQPYITFPPARIAVPVRVRTIRETVLLPIPV